jgi:hypothetical protein
MNGFKTDIETYLPFAANSLGCKNVIYIYIYHKVHKGRRNEHDVEPPTVEGHKAL